MRLRLKVGILAALVLSLGAITAMYGVEIADPYVWLEDVHGTKPLEWVQEHNQVALKQLKAGPDYQRDYDTILALLDADDRIPTGQLHGESVFNFWQDKAHVRGIWRRTNIASYETPVPQWDTILDIDELAKAENKSWVFKGATCSPDLVRCLVKLSPGGGDTVVLREFDPNAKRFDSLTYIDVLNRRLGVMDATAISLCMENKLPVVVFKLTGDNNLIRAVRGEPVGTVVK